MNDTPRYNTVTDTNVTSFVRLISPLNRSLTIRPGDNVYYFLRMSRLDPDLQNIRTATERALDTDSPEEITVDNWFVVDTEDGDILKHDPGAAKELYFLLFLGLAMRIENTGQYAVNPEAVDLLYDDDHGLFTTGATANDAAVDAFEHYLNTIVLPAYYWRYHYVTKDLPADSYDVAMAARQMSRIREILNPM